MLRKTSLKVQCTPRAAQKKGGRLLQCFKAEPRQSKYSLFLSDNQVLELVQSSRYSLQFISLTNTPMLTACSFVAISLCRHLQHLQLSSNA